MADASSPLMDQLAAITLDEVPKDNFSDHIPIQSIISHINGGSGLASRKARVGSWVKTGCKANKDIFALLEINDRSCTGNLQSGWVNSANSFPPEHASSLTATSNSLRADKVLHVGSIDPAKYPLPKMRLTLEFLRDFIHLHSKTNTIFAVARIRNSLTCATHTFFNKEGFLYVHTPIVSTSDCEGVGEMFQVMSQLKAAKASKKEIGAAVDQLKKANESLAKVDQLKPEILKKDDGKDYFATPPTIVPRWIVYVDRV
ncbi:Asparagine--tRNA ligase, cytoplasmic 3 [Glycine max]|nr:Asparagine--tRNA ligase, cytoplasmic 3 [Glycine max]